MCTVKEQTLIFKLYYSRFKEAEAVYEDLLKRNPENVMYYHKLIEARQLTSTDDKVAFFNIFKWVLFYLYKHIQIV